MIDSKVPKNLTDLVFAEMSRPRVGNELDLQASLGRKAFLLAEEFC